MNRHRLGHAASRPCHARQPHGDRRQSRQSLGRRGLTLSRLSALVARGFMPGLSAVGASFNDHLGLNPANLRLLSATSAVTELILNGHHGSGVDLRSDGVGQVARMRAGTTAVLNGARLFNLRGGTTFVEGTSRLSDKALPCIGEGSALVVERGGKLHSVFDLYGHISTLENAQAYTPGLAGGLITNRGTIELAVTTQP